MLTLAQKKTEEFIRQFFDKNGYAPTASEIAEGIGIKSRGVVHRYLTALVGAGKIELTPKRHRNIRLLPLFSSLPLLGSIAAGHPIEAISQEDTINVVDIFMGPDRYALKVKGDSMIEEGILDGDIVVCQKANSARNGQIVVALIDSGEVTLKRFQLNPDKTVTLFPANSKLSPIMYSVDRVIIQGIYIGLIRS